MADDKYNMKNPAVKRILQEVKEMQSNPSDDFMSLPLEENIFEWQFAIRGPCETEFEGGIYHGRIQLPSEYPFKPPSFMLLTPNGRFETQTKICLSISNHHPEHWQPSWSVRTALVALIAFMPTNPNGALGSLDYPKNERRALAIKSREASPKFGNPERQKLIDEIHAYMLGKSPSVPESVKQATDEQSSKAEIEVQSSTLEGEAHVSTESSRIAEPAGQPADIGNEGNVEEPHQAPASVGPPHVALREARQIPDVNPAPQMHRQVPVTGVQRAAADDRLFTLAVVGLTMAIVFLLLKKFMKSQGYGAFLMNDS